MCKNAEFHLQAERLVILVSSTLILSYISSYLYSKTRIPDVLSLIGFGILVGPVFNLIDVDLFHTLVPLMSIVALGIILFDAGLNFDLNTLLGSLMKSTILSISSIIASISIIGIISSWLFPKDFTLLQGMLLGAMVGGTSTVVVFGIMSSLKNTFDNLFSAEILLIMESIISDPVCIISSITFIKMIMLPGVSFMSGIQDISKIFLFSALLGFFIGLFWAFILSLIRGRPFTYIITLSILFPSYLFGETAIGEGAGPMIALMFGLTISNINYILGNLGISIKIDSERLREFHEEVTFFIKSFFFVYIGLIVTLSLNNMLIGLGIALLLMIIRYFVVEIIGYLRILSLEEKFLSQFIYASGLPAFVMSQLPTIFDKEGVFFANPSIYSDLAMPIVLGTIVFSSFIGPAIIKRLIPSRLKT